MLSDRHLGLNHWVSALFDVYDVGVVNRRSHVFVLLSCLGSREQTVEMGYETSVGLYLLCVLLSGCDEFVEELCLQCENLLLGTENLLLVFLQFLGDVSLSLGESLLANPVLWHLFLVCVSHLKVVTEDIVISYLQTLYSCVLYLPFLNLQQVVLAVVGYVTKLVEFLVHTIVDHVALVYKLWGVGVQFVFYPVADFLA